MSQPHPVPAGRQLPRGHLLVLNRSFRRTLEAENKSPRTIEAYTDAVRLLATYLQARGKPPLAGELRREHIQAFIADQLARWKPATAHNRYRGLHAFFKWAVAEGDLAANPMDGMKPPQLPEQPIDVVRPEHLARLLKTCQGRGIYQVVHDRARAAGLPAMHPHQLRHAFATSWLAEGGNENELMLVAGWKSRTMIDRYTKATAVERARASHARLSPADRL
jgi:site-specific recombinase XerD